MNFKMNSMNLIEINEKLENTIKKQAKRAFPMRRLFAQVCIIELILILGVDIYYILTSLIYPEWSNYLGLYEEPVKPTDTLIILSTIVIGFCTALYIAFIVLMRKVIKK